MRIHPRKRWHKPLEATGPKFNLNEAIKAEKVRVIDENGEHLGVLETPKAVEIAQERGYDLVEVDPKGNPPTCKILNYGQFKYEKERELRKQKSQSKQVDTKGIRLAPRIGEHDIETRLKNAKKFLEAGHKLKIEMRLRGREKAHGDLAREVIMEFLNKLREDFDIVVEQPIARSGGQLTTTVGKK